METRPGPALAPSPASAAHWPNPTGTKGLGGTGVTPPGCLPGTEEGVGMPENCTDPATASMPGDQPVLPPDHRQPGPACKGSCEVPISPGT